MLQVAVKGPGHPARQYAFAYVALQSCYDTLLKQGTFAIALLAFSSNNDISSGSWNPLFRAVSIPRLGGFILFSLSGAWLFCSVRMT